VRWKLKESATCSTLFPSSAGARFLSHRGGSLIRPGSARAPCLYPLAGTLGSHLLARDSKEAASPRDHAPEVEGRDIELSAAVALVGVISQGVQPIIFQGRTK